MAALLGAGLSGVQAEVSETNTFSALSKTIPDGMGAGVHEVRTVSSDIIFITSVRVRLNISGNFNGDLYAYLRHSSGLAVLLNRPGRTATSSYGYSDAGLNVVSADSAPTDIHGYRSVSTPAPGAPLTGTWQPDARLVPANVVSDTSTRSAFLSAFNGLNADGTWTLFLADTDLGGTNVLNSWSLEITGNPRVTPLVTWTNPADIVYGIALSETQLNATASVPGTFVYYPAAGTFLNAGNSQSLSVTFNPTDTTVYRSVTTNVSLNVLPKALTITADDKTKVYGAPLPVFTASYAGFVEGEGPSNLATPVTFSTSATASSLVGTYAITPGGATAQNYAITFVNGTLAITPAALSVAADNASRVYGAENPAFTGTVTGVLNGDNITTSGTTTATTNSPVGAYDIVPVLVDPENRLTNYTVYATNGTLTVTPATITVTANDKTKVYGAPLPDMTATYDGFVLGEDTNSFTTLATLSTPATATSDVGTYTITAGGATAVNYAFNYAPGTLTVTQALTTGTLSTSTNPADPGADVTFTMNISPVAPGAGTPGGTVSFRIDGSVAGVRALPGGTATFTLNTLAPGSHSVAAEYAGSLNFAGVTNTLTPDQVVNAPPDGGDILQRYPAQGVKVRAAKLLENDPRPNDEPLTLASVSETSAGGGTVTLRDGWVFYQPPAGFTNADSFTYAATNASGTNLTVSVTVNIRTDVEPSQNILGIEDLGNGSRRVQFQGIPERTYSIQYSDQLEPAGWQPLGTSQADETGWFEFIDSPATNAPVRFYRSTYP